MSGAITFSEHRTLAQITPDATLGAESSTVTPGNIVGSPTDVIGGGATRGTNLFHSFQEFSLPTARVGYFNNAADIQNIISRVTGTSVSNIDGLILANGTANLFLLNPNGIIFGPNAELAIGGSFVASTAESLVFDNNFAFSATNPQAPPLLTINVPIGLQFGLNPGSVANQSVIGLEVEPGRTLALVGGDVAIEGGVLTAPDGRIELGSVAANNSVSLIATDTGYVLDYEGVSGFQDISLSQAAFVSTSGEGGGSIQVQGANVTLSDQTFMVAETLGNQNGGGIFIQALGLTVEGGSSVSTDVDGSGQGGNVTIETGQLLVSDGSEVSARTFGEGTGGSLSINATESVQVIGESADGQLSSSLTVTTFGTGEAGYLTINTPQLLISDGAVVSARTYGEGAGGSLSINATESVQVIGTSTDGQFRSGLSVDTFGTGEGGDLTINTAHLLVADGAGVSARTFGEGAGGSLKVNATESVQVIGTSTDGQFYSDLSVATFGAEEGGDLTINAARLLVADGAGVSASTFDEGAGGSLSINATESVQVIGTSANGEFGSDLSVGTLGAGEGGDLTINTSQLLVSDGAFVSADTFDEGAGGSLSINATESVQVIGTSADGRLSSNLSVGTLGAGEGGDLTINTARLLVSDGALVSADTDGEGAGGSLTVNATESVQVIGTSADGQFYSALTAETEGTGEGGDLTINTAHLLVSDGATVSARTYGERDGGILSINATESVQVIGTSADSGLGSDLSVATSGIGEGGDLTINTAHLLVSDGAFVSAETYGEGAGGSLIIDATESVQVIGTRADGQLSSNLSVGTLGAGEGGDLTINTSQLLVSDGGFVSADTFEEGSGGSLSINATESVQVIGTRTDGRSSHLSVETLGTGEEGELTINTARLLVSAGAFVSASTFDAGDGGSLTVNAIESVQVLGTSADGQSSYLSVASLGAGEGGDLTINTSELLVSDGAFVSASTNGSGTGGSLSINATESVQVIGTPADGQFSSNLSVGTLGAGEGGDLTINTSRLLVSDGAYVLASTFDEGDGGSLSINATESVQVIGTADGEIGSGLAADTGGTGEAGELTINTARLLVSDGSFISAGSYAEGAAGSLNITASDSVHLSSGGFLTVQATQGGTAGNLTVETGQMSVSDGAGVTVSSPDGQAGNLTITANSLTLNQGSITAETGTSGAEGGANITLNGLDLLLMGNESLISANALGTANGGNITIDSKFIVATPPTGSEGSDIVANAVNGDGGRVNITTEGLFDTDFRPRRTPLNDITASSETGAAGVVSITTPNVDPSRGLGELPTNLVDAQGLIDRSCTAGRGSAFNSSFTVTGRGGLPSNPLEPLNSDAVVSNWVSLDSEQENPDSAATNTNPASTTPNQIVEAQGWVKTPDGRVILLAQAPTVTPQSSWLTSPSCQDAQPTND